MKDICTKNAPLARPFIWRQAVVCSMLLLISGCGKDSGDGEVINVIELPAAGDLELNLYCVDFGLFIETCVLDDPDNPYAVVSLSNDPTVKFDQAPDIAVSPKGLVYYWATLQARFPGGENQLFTGRVLYQLSNLSCSKLIQDQALRAYRSVMDNYLPSVTFFSTADFATFEVFYPFPARIVAAQEMRLGVGAADVSCDPSFNNGLMFDPNGGEGGKNDFDARVRIFEWGFLFDDTPLDVTKR